MDSKVTYRQQVSFCGKPQCRKCREGVGHGPYWYAYHTTEQGRTVRTYVGKRLPNGVSEAQVVQVAERRYQAGQTDQAEQSVRNGQNERDVRSDGARKADSALVLADNLIAQEAFTTAIEQLGRLVASDSTNEAAVQRLIFVLARLKRRGEAIRVYQKFAAALQARKRSEPSNETHALFEAILRGDDPLLFPTPVGTDSSRPPLSHDHPHPNAVGADVSRPSAEETQELVGADSSRPHPISPKSVGDGDDEGEADAMSRPLPGRMNSKDSSFVGRVHQRPMVGREMELAALHEFVFTAGTVANNHSDVKQAGALPLDTRRRAQWMLLMGEAGIGKTRLIEEVAEQAQQQRWEVLWSRMYAQESSIPYRQWIEILRNAALQGLWQMKELEQRPDVFAPLGALLPELQDVLPYSLHASSLSPQQEQQHLWESVLALFAFMSRKQALLVVLDDLQWADSSSCELLGYLARRMAGQAIVFVGACRESELAPNHVLHGLVAHMQREHTIMTLAIQPLTNTEIRTMVGHLPADVVTYIQQQAAGNPFFAEELAFSSSGAFTEPSALSTGKQTDTRRKHSALPESIRAALDHRISKLSRPCQQLLSNAAVLGGSFEFTLMRAMESYGANQKDEDTILDLLDEALQAGVLAEEGRGTRIRYHFWHPLLVSHLYERLSVTRRALLHRRAAEILQQLYARREEEGAATITYHLMEGGAEDERIVHYAELAGNSAYILSAYPDAERYYRLVLERTGSDPVWQTKRALLLERLGECARIQGHFEDAQHFYEQILAGYGEGGQGGERGTLEERQREAQIEALLWCEVGWNCYYMGDKTRAIACRERGEQVLRAADVARGGAWATVRYQKGFISWLEGNYDEAYEAASEAQLLFEETLQQHPRLDGQEMFSTRIRRTLAGDPVDLARIHRLLGSIANSVGRPTEGLLHLNRALSILEKHEQKREVGHVCCNIGYIHLQKAEYEQAHAFFNRSLALAEQIGDMPLTSVVYSNLGILAARTGKLTEAEDWYRRGLVLAEQINDYGYVSMGHTLLSDVLQQQGKLSEARSCLCRALLPGKKVGNIPCIGLALVSAGNLRIMEARLAEQRGDMGQHRRSLLRASRTLQNALALDGLEAETRAEGQLAMAEVALLSGNNEDALHQATAVLEKAQAHELTWLVERTQFLMRNIKIGQ